MRKKNVEAYQIHFGCQPVEFTKKCEKLLLDYLWSRLVNTNNSTLTYLTKDINKNVCDIVEIRGTVWNTLWLATSKKWKQLYTYYYSIFGG